MKKLENPEPYKHVMVSYKIGLTNFSKKVGIMILKILTVCQLDGKIVHTDKDLIL
jgi:hypothetical protein